MAARHGRLITCGHPRVFGFDRAREFGLTRVAHGVEQRIAICKMAVRSVRGNADPAGRLAEHDRVWATLSGEFHAGGQQRVPEVTVVIADPR
jgi:hypothetical protein